MSKQVLDIEQMKHLQELGLDTSNASMCYVVDDSKAYKPILCVSGNESEYLDAISYSVCAFTLQDILDLLPKQIVAGSSGYTYNLDINYEKNYIAYSYTDGNGYVWLNQSFRINDNLIEAAYKMLCWCIENEHIKRNI